jgi:hypothetical protein
VSFYRDYRRRVHKIHCSLQPDTTEDILAEDKETLSAHQVSQILDSLKFDLMDVRHLNIKTAHAKTCKWLLQKPAYMSWLDSATKDQPHPFLWIKGNPGTGKSTLMKFALGSARRKLRDTTTISFFFNPRGHGLEKTAIGMYRSLLVQLLERHPKLQGVLTSFKQSTWIDDYHIWSLESLKLLLKNVVHSIGKAQLVRFTDALDEYDEAEVRDMVSFFSHLGQLDAAAG